MQVQLTVLQGGSGGRLEVDLLAKTAGKQRLAGRAVRNGLPAGKLSVPVPLNARAKKALRRRPKLALTVKIQFTPSSGSPTVVTRSVTERR